MSMRPLLTALALAAALPLKAAVPDDILKAVAASVLPVDIRDDKGVTQTLNGLVTGKNEITLPCLPLMQAQTLSVREASGNKEAFWTLSDPARNLCLLKVTGLDAPPLSPAGVKDLAPGDSVYLVGQLLGLSPVISAGRIRSLSHSEDGALLMQITPHAFPGSEAGAVFDAQHRLIGMLQQSLPHGSDDFTAVAADSIETIRDRAKPVAKLKPARTTPEPNWQIAFDDAIDRRAWSKLEFLARKHLYLYPDNPTGLTYLGQALLNGKRPPTAIPYLELALKKDPNAIQARSYLAAARLANGEAAEAQTLARDAIARRPGDALPHTVLGDVLQADGRLEEAAAAYEQACRLMPGEAGYWLKLGRARQSLDQWPEAVRAQRIAYKLTPDDADAKSELIRSLSRLALWDEVRTLTENPLDVTAALKEAQIARKAGRTQQADRLYRRILLNAPKSMAALEDIANFLIEQQRFGEAEKIVADGAPLDEKGTTFLRMKGQILLLQGNMTAAEAQLQTTVNTNPEDLAAWRLLYVARDNLRDYPGAQAAIQQVMDKSGKQNVDPDTHARDLLMLTRVLLVLGQLDKAEEALNQVLSRQPDNNDALLAKAALLGRRGKPAEAVAIADQVLERNPRSITAMSNKGYALLQQNRVAEAEEVLERAGTIAPRDGNLLVNLAQVYLRQERTTWALPLLEQSLRLAPRYEDLRQQLMTLYIDGKQADKAKSLQVDWIKLFPESPRAIYWGGVLAIQDGKMEEANSAFGRLEELGSNLAENLKSLIDKKSSNTAP